ncbi:MAG: hypothetical protein VKJ05_06485 [Synechococcaceae cyanobacterium]|nr:hypothetical protein [Synechococcaceae cyanobacterium]
MGLTVAIQAPLRARRHRARLGCHASWYRDNLALCNEAMLQYEWAWIKGRIATLIRYRADGCRYPQDGKLERLLHESQRCRSLLRQEFSRRGLRPLPPRGPVVASEEAWEITSCSVRQAWGIGR